MTESMNGINDAMSRGLDINGEYLETIREYSPFMKQAGIDFNQFNILIQKQLTDGIFSDKGIDAIKEAVLSIQEMTPVTKDALKAAGFNTDQLIKEIESGAKTYFEVVQDIGRAMEDVTDPRSRGQVLADVFKGAGEDAGEFALTLHQVGTEYGALTKEQEAFVKTQTNLVDASEDLNEQLIALTKNIGPLEKEWTTFWTKTAAGTLRFINESIDGLARVTNQTNDFVRTFERWTPEAQAAEVEKLKDEYDRLNGELKESNKKRKEFLGSFGNEGEQVKKDLTEVSLKLEALKIVDKNRADEQQAAQDELNAKLEEEAKKRQAIIDKQNEELRLTKAKRDESVSESAALGDIEGKAPDLESQIVDEKLSLEEKLKEDTLKIRQETSDAQAEIDARDLEKQQEKADATKEIVFAGLEGLAEITSGFANLRIQQIQQELTALEFARNRELELAEGNAEKEAVINAKFDAQKRELQKKQANTEKLNAIFSIAVSTAIGIANAASKVVTIPMIPIIAAIGAAQAAFVLAQPIPQFAEGVLKLKGKGSGTSDSIPAMLSAGESVMTARNTDDYYPTLKAIHNNEISPEVLNQMVLNGGTQPNITVNDYDKLAKALLDRPEKNVIMDESGFTGHIVRKGQYIRLKQSKYKM